MSSTSFLTSSSSSSSSSTTTENDPQPRRRRRQKPLPRVNIRRCDGMCHHCNNNNNNNQPIEEPSNDYRSGGDGLLEHKQYCYDNQPQPEELSSKKYCSWNNNHNNRWSGRRRGRRRRKEKINLSPSTTVAQKDFDGTASNQFTTMVVRSSRNIDLVSIDSINNDDDGDLRPRQPCFNTVNNVNINNGSNEPRLDNLMVAGDESGRKQIVLLLKSATSNCSNQCSGATTTTTTATTTTTNKTITTMVEHPNLVSVAQQDHHHYHHQCNKRRNNHEEEQQHMHMANVKLKTSSKHRHQQQQTDPVATWWCGWYHHHHHHQQQQQQNNINQRISSDYDCFKKIMSKTDHHHHHHPHHHPQAQPSSTILSPSLFSVQYQSWWYGRKWLRPTNSFITLFFTILLSSSFVLPVISNESQPPQRERYSRYYPAHVQQQQRQNHRNRNDPGTNRRFDQSSSPETSLSIDPEDVLPPTFTGGEILGMKILTKQQTQQQQQPIIQEYHPDGATSQQSITNHNNNWDYVIRSDIIIPSKQRLQIEPGVRLAFAPGIGITVHGSLNAKGTSSSKVVFGNSIDNDRRPLQPINPTFNPTATSINNDHKPVWPNVRLVDGGVIEEGRLQIKYKSKWHSVCTNSRNWTQTNVEVICRQLGFTGGHWFRWFARNNDTRQFMLENPGCRGDEPSLQDCSHWHQKRIGSGVCDFHQDIGIRCDTRMASNSPIISPTQYWKGIEFINADSHITSIMSNKMDVRVSDSVLEYVDIEYAGQDLQMTRRSALLIIGGVPPHINELKIYRSAYTALNVTDPINGFEIMNSKFKENRAYGVYVNSSVGRVVLSSVEVEDNGADGVRFIHFDKPFYSSDSFCETPNLGTSQVFPIKYTHRQSASKAPTEECCQEFYSKDWEGQRITAHFPILMSGIEDYDAKSEYIQQPYIPHVGQEGSIYVVDGHSGRIIADFFIRNNTKTQSVSSIVGNGPLRICYRPAHYRRILFTVEVVVDFGREYDMVISNSRIVANNGRGLWFQDLRSGAVVNRTLIADHDYVAGLHVDRGVGEVIVNNSIISGNLVDGINITNGGGFLHIDRTDFLNNSGSGIAVWYNASMNLQAFNYSSHVTRCALSDNQVGLSISNGCHFISSLKQSAFWNISLNHFKEQREQAILYHSCIPRPRILKMLMKPIVTNISISHNHFVGNDLHAIHAAPLFFAKLNIAHNEFSRHKKAVLYINSQDSFNVQNFVEDAERFPFSFYNQGNSLTNQRSLALDLWPVVVRIRNNNFHQNRGHYVASIGLLEPESSANVNYSSLAQKVLFTRNILHDNVVHEPFENLNPRSRISAVLCVTSSNVLVWRNEFVNPQSKYELGVHLSAHFRLVNASLNYWGTSNSMGNSVHFNDKHLHSAAEIYERIFDRKNRYNLAQVEFLPYIMIPNALESDRSALSLVNDRDKIIQFFHGSSSGEIGGQVKGQVNLPAGKYFVKRDIYISPEGELVLNPGTVFYFDQSVGVLVQGKFKAKGDQNSDIKFLLASSKSSKIKKRQTEKSSKMKNSNNNDPVVVNAMVNETLSNPLPVSLKLRQSSNNPAQNIRLSNGTEGRLEVKIGNEWGSVCGYNFDIEDAAVACHQLGLVLNERDWRLEKSEFWNPGAARSVLLTNVHCTHLDTDLTKCKAERMSDSDFEGGWCPKGEVGIRCFPEAWAGIRFGMLTQEVILDYVTVEKAGLIDYRTRVFGPAVQFDFNRFSIRNAIINNNIDSGLGISWNDVLSEPNNDRLQITDTKINGNLNHGIITRTQGIKIENCLISENKVSGFHYEPNFSREKQEELASWIVKQPIHNRKVSVFVISPGETASDQSIYLGDIGRQIYIYIPRRPQPTVKPFNLMIKTDPGKRIGVMAISPIFLTRSSESLRLFSPMIDSIHAAKMMWDLRKNLTMFPFVYPGYRLMLEYSTGELPYGGILLLVTPKQYLRSNPGEPGIVEKSLQEHKDMNTMLLVKNEFIQNGKGITSSHCSMNIDLNGNYCKRYCNETIIIQNNLITKSKGAGMFVNSHAYSSMIPYSLLVNLIEFNEMPFQEYDITYAASVIAEINYTLIENRFVENADFGSIVLYDHSLYANGDMQRANVQSMPGFIMSNAIGANQPSNTNLFHWNIFRCTLEQNKNGGIDLRLPYTWLYNENFTHTVVVEESSFIRNQNFEFVIGGHYAKVNITKNMFIENQCKIGLVSVRGMEKLMLIENNEMRDNFVQKYALEMNMESHADKFGTVTALIHRNIIRNNRFTGTAIRDQTPVASLETSGSSYTPETYTISIRGLQQVNVTRNILVNKNLQFELLAGVRAGSIHNELNAKENFWGVSNDRPTIQQRIFDFDDWNSFSTTLFSPWLASDHLDAQLVYEPSYSSNKDNQTFISDRLGGRLSESLVLHPRKEPYIVQTDLTIMPGTVLTIRPGVVMEFYPSVGILVLGDLNAIGMENRPITLRPVGRNSTNSISMDTSFKLGFKSSDRKRHIPTTEQLVFSKSDHGGVRLCLTEACDPDSEMKAEVMMKKKLTWLEDSGYPKATKRHGFLEIYNTTTLQWTPICDPRFTERDAQVVCRQLGFSTLNVFVCRGPRPDMDPTLTTRIGDWPESLECTGTESSLAECDLRTFSKDSYDRKSTMFENAPLYHSKMSSTNFYRKTHYSYIGDNRTQELMFYLNDDWRSLEERSLVQSTACRHDGDEFVYILCGEDNNRFPESQTPFEHWGGIRFAIPEFEESDSWRYSSRNNIKKIIPQSSMQFVNVIGAGILHGEKNAAIQMVQRSIPLQFVNVHQSAYHGIETLAPPESLKLHRLRVENNLGAGLNHFLLGTSTSESTRVPYEPITDGSTFSVPYNAFSLVDICDARKQLRVKEKVIVYYKYDNRPVDCVKIFTSANPLKLIGIRFLQLNLWSKFAESEGKTNTIYDDYIQGKKFAFQSEDIFHNKIQELSHETSGSYLDESLINSMSDSIMIWDGDIFNETTRRLAGEIYSDSTREFLRRSAPAGFQNNNNDNFRGAPNSGAKHSRHSRYVGSTRHPPLGAGTETDAKNILYKSTGFSLSLQLHVSGASSQYGFIAEVTTLPSAYFDERNVQHNITYSEIVNNTAGAMMYQSVGESVPQLALLNNMFKRNCRNLWGNFSTCTGNAVDLKMQNTPHLYFQNNLVGDNRAGGLKISATSFTAVSALNAHLINNLFSDNYGKEALYFEGANSYQTVNVERNYFSRNRSPHRSNMVFGRAIVLFQENVVINNYGDNQLFMAGFAHAQSSAKLQRCTKNFFYNNHASNERGEQSTIIVSTIGQIYTDNYLVNPDNDFEMATRNRTIIDVASYQLKQNIIEPTSFAAVLASAIVQAPYNWWGFNETSAIEARIRDSRDSHHLIPVQFEPFYTGNWSVLSGSCYGGYQKIADTCFVYVGGRMTYHQARKFCSKDNSSMPFVRAANQDELTRYIYIQQPLFDRRRHPVWVQSFDVPIGSCSVLIDGSVRVHDCDDELPFLCERDPEIGLSTATLEYWYQEPLGMAVIAISFFTLLLIIACVGCWICKSRHRHMQKMERRNSIRASIRSSRSLASMNALSDSQYFTNRKLLSESNPNVNGTMNGSNYQLNRQSQHQLNMANVNGQPSITKKQVTSNFEDSLSSTFSIYPDNAAPEERLILAQKRYQDAVKMNGFNNGRNSIHQSQTSLMQPQPPPSTFDLVYDNRGFKAQPGTPISPVSFSSREDQQPPRTWTPDTNSTLDFKVKPALDPQELSQYTGSTEDLHKPPPSTSSSEASSDLAAPASVISRTSIQKPRFYQMKPQLRTPVNPPPPPPVKRMIQMRDREYEARKQSQQQRKSMDPAFFMETQDEPMETTFDSELLTFGSKPTRQPEIKQKPSYLITDLDGNGDHGHHQLHHHHPMGGSQPSLIYGSYTASTVATQESNNPYLETSLDNESYYNENFNPSAKNQDFATIQRSLSPATNAATKARLYASQPLETSM